MKDRNNWLSLSVIERDERIEQYNEWERETEREREIDRKGMEIVEIRNVPNQIT